MDSWTDTYDVLKPIKCVFNNSISMLEPTHMMYWNLTPKEHRADLYILNRHIWCIETKLQVRLVLQSIPWTDTYDVLKQATCNSWKSKSYTWTDTYDVLKQLNNVSNFQGFFSWTDTYDVLKQSNCICIFCHYLLEPTHMMYWNRYHAIINSLKNDLEPTHMMYWNFHNCNSLCEKSNAWTDTYDVLKQYCQQWK